MKAILPSVARQSLRRARHAVAILTGRFGDRLDPFYLRLGEWVGSGDIAVDVGAAVGDYAIRLSNLVGPTGRVIALEPVQEQFEILAANVAYTRNRNVTCLQLAAGESTGVVRMAVPEEGGRPVFYMSRIASDGVPVLQAPLDQIPLPGRVSFLKVDAEGADFSVLRGAIELIQRDRPVIYVESSDSVMVEWLQGLGYSRHLSDPESPNHVHLP